MALESIRANMMSVRTFGAVGDGEVDDTAAFVSAIAIGTDNRKAIFVPSGTYLVDPLTVTLPTGGAEGGRFTLYGEGPNTSILKLKTESDQPILKISGPGTSQSAWFVNIREIGFDGNADHYSGSGEPPFPAPFPLLRFENLVYSQFSNLRLTNALFGGIEDIADENLSGGTTSRHNQYDTISFNSVRNETQDEEMFALLLQNSKFFVLTNISIEDWGAGIHIEDTLTSGGNPESGGFTNIQGLTVVSCPGDALRLTACNWINVNGLSCMWIGRDSNGNYVGDGVPIRTIGPDTQGGSAGTSHIIISNFISRNNKNEHVVIRGPEATAQLMLTNGYMSDGTAGVDAMGLVRCILSNLIFNSVKGDAILLQQEPVGEENNPVDSADNVLSSIIIRDCKDGIHLMDYTTRIRTDSVEFVSTPSSTFGGTFAVKTDANVSDCRFGILNLSMDAGTPVIDLSGTDNYIFFDGDRVNVTEEYRVNDVRVVKERLGYVDKVPASPTNAELATAVNLLIDRLDEGGHGLIEDPQ